MHLTSVDCILLLPHVVLGVAHPEVQAAVFHVLELANEALVPRVTTKEGSTATYAC